MVQEYCVALLGNSFDGDSVFGIIMWQIPLCSVWCVVDTLWYCVEERSVFIVHYYVVVLCGATGTTVFIVWYGVVAHW